MSELIAFFGFLVIMIPLQKRRSLFFILFYQDNWKRLDRALEERNQSVLLKKHEFETRNESLLKTFLAFFDLQDLNA